MEHELENKDKQLEKLAARQHEVGHDTLPEKKHAAVYLQYRSLPSNG